MGLDDATSRAIIVLLFLNKVGPMFRRKMMTGFLSSRGISASEERVGAALQVVRPQYHEARQEVCQNSYNTATITRNFIPPHPCICQVTYHPYTSQALPLLLSLHPCIGQVSTLHNMSLHRQSLHLFPQCGGGVRSEVTMSDIELNLPQNYTIFQFGLWSM